MGYFLFRSDKSPWLLWHVRDIPGKSFKGGRKFSRDDWEIIEEYKG